MRASKRGNYAQADTASIRGDQLQSLQMSLAVSLVQFLLYEVRTAAQEQICLVPNIFKLQN